MAMYSIGDLAFEAEDDHSAAVLFGLVLGELPSDVRHLLWVGSEHDARYVTGRFLDPADHDRIYLKAQRIARRE